MLACPVKVLAPMYIRSIYKNPTVLFLYLKIRKSDPFLFVFPTQVQVK